MHFLSYIEIGRLQYILIHRTILRAADPDTRSSLLTNCGLSHICGIIPLNLPTDKFVVNLCSKLSELHLTVDNSERLGLVIFLEYLSLFDANLSDDEKVFFEHVKTKWEQSQTSGAQRTRHNHISSLLNQVRQDQPYPSSEQKPVKIDKGIIVNYNLDEQVALFKQNLGYEGAFTFTVGGNFNILERYIIERIRRELRTKTERPHQPPFEIRLYRDNVSTPADIERKLVTCYELEHLTDLFDKESNTDIVLIIWNYDLPAPKMKSIAIAFWEEIESRLLTLLQDQGRCFVIIWANVDREPLEVDRFTCLPTPDKFELSDLIPWFRGKLKQLGIEESLIEHYLNRLRDQCGHLIGTYQEMNRIIYELQGGSNPP